MISEDEVIKVAVRELGEPLCSTFYASALSLKGVANHFYCKGLERAAQMCEHSAEAFNAAGFTPDEGVCRDMAEVIRAEIGDKDANRTNP